EDRRQTTLDEQLAELPYINGKLFEEMLPLADFDAQMRALLLDASSLDWSRISPAIFGSMFQSVMNAKARRNLGAGAGQGPRRAGQGRGRRLRRRRKSRRPQTAQTGHRRPARGLPVPALPSVGVVAACYQVHAESPGQDIKQ